MDIEPVAWLLSGGGTKNVVCFDSGNAYADPLREVTPLYRHAQPAPVVPEEVLKSFDLLFHRSYFRRWVKDPQGYVSGSIPVRDLVNVVLFAEACRAAILAAATHKTPALNSVQSVAAVPGKWIPVSERMPENKPGSYEYLVFETLNNRVNHDYWNVPDKGDDAFALSWNYYGGHVTHWMPLPASPQEVKGE
ncbi:TPA: DUF551 domain-containing protein [Klebsiella pneumoniae]